jgi:tyrosyl-tRNA synthetase
MYPAVFFAIFSCFNSRYAKHCIDYIEQRVRSVNVGDFLKVMKERGFMRQISDEAALSQAFSSGETVTAYIGFDPTASSLHVGSLLPIMGLAHLQRCGHRPIAILGGGTAMVGDPSGKTELRQLLTREQIKINLAGIKEQIGRFITFGSGKTDALMLDNADWLCEWSYVDFLREVGRHFSVNRMLTQESVKMRMETGISFIEFNYMLLQAYDFMHLNREVGCTLQMGGDDQWGNIVMGIDLTRRMNQKQVYGLTYPLITTASGAKMGKTAQGAIWLDAERTSPYDFYQYWINSDDRDVGRFLRLFTFLPMEEIERLDQLKGADIREAKQVLATEVTTLVHGKDAAEEAQRGAAQAFGGGGNRDNLPSTDISPGSELLVVDLFMAAGLCKSKSEFRRLVQQGGAYMEEERVTDLEAGVPAELQEKGELVIRQGKKKHHRIQFK